MFFINRIIDCNTGLLLLFGILHSLGAFLLVYYVSLMHQFLSACYSFLLVQLLNRRPVLAHASFAVSLALAALTVMVMLGGCSSGSSFSESSVALELDDDNVLVMGTVSRIPSFLAADLKHETHADKLPHSDQVTLWFKDYHRDRNAVERAEETLSLTTSWDMPFEFLMPKKALILNRIEVHSDAHSTVTTRQFILPSLYTYLVRVDDQALYVGNLRLYTNEFDEVIAVELVDESSAARLRAAGDTYPSVRFRVSLFMPQ